jgi:MSHA biogenesis protein MshJ
MKDNSAKQSALGKFKEKFDGLKKREQNLLFVAIPLTIAAVFVLLLIEPEIKNAQRLEASVSRLESQLSLSNQSNEELMRQAQINPNTALSEQIASLEKRLSKLNAEFEGELSQLVSPSAMPVLLEQIFAQADSLSLINMKSVAPQVLITNGINRNQADEKDGKSNSDTAEGSNSNQQPIYRHGIEITFEGSFFATRDFLSQAEALGWKLYWQDLSYEVSEHPNAVTQMTLFTLSTSEAFIGVN